MRLPAIALLLTLAACRGTQPALATAEPDAAKYSGCQVLRIYPTTSLRDPIVVPDGGILCSHGSVVQILPSASRVETISLAQSVVNGPDCNITLTVGSSTYVINAQQGYCLEEAGKVTATVVTGDATIGAVTEGSIKNKAPGMVRVALH